MILAIILIAIWAEVNIWKDALKRKPKVVKKETIECGVFTAYVTYYDDGSMEYHSYNNVYHYWEC